MPNQLGTGGARKGRQLLPRVRPPYDNRFHGVAVDDEEVVPENKRSKIIVGEIKRGLADNYEVDALESEGAKIVAGEANKDDADNYEDVAASNESLEVITDAVNVNDGKTVKIEKRGDKEGKKVDARSTIWPFRISEASPEFARVQAEIRKQQSTLKVKTDAECLAGYLNRLTARRKNALETGMVGVPTGLKSLDAATGGLQGITIIAGNTGSGKTSFAMQVCIAALRADPELAVTYFMFDEMSVDDLMDQAVCHIAKIDHRRYVGAQLGSAETSAVQQATDYLESQIATRMRTVKLVRANVGSMGFILFNNAFNLAKQVGVRRMLTVIDMFEDMYLPRLSNDEYHGELSSVLNGTDSLGDRWRLEQVLDLQARLQQASSHESPILVLGKLRKQLFRQDEPELADLKGSVELAYKAKRIYYLLPANNAPPGADSVPVALVVKKARHGTAVRVPLTFHHTQFRFDDNSGSCGGGTQKKPSPKRRDAGPAASHPDNVIDPLAGLER